MKLYRHAEWKQFRNEVIKLHGGQCARCLRSRADGVVLQVHHKGYLLGRLPWEYGHAECEALCQGCHAQEHGKIMPQSGWQCIGTDDLGDIADNCELCGQDIRYVYAITHSQWGSMAVGTDCCDRLTGTAQASEHHNKYIRKIDTRKRFVGSKRWKIFENGDIQISQKGIRVQIVAIEQKFIIVMNTVKGKELFDTVLDAKMRVFDLIDTGEAERFLSRRRERELEKLRRELGLHSNSRRVSPFRARKRS